MLRCSKFRIQNSEFRINACRMFSRMKKSTYRDYCFFCNDSLQGNKYLIILNSEFIILNYKLPEVIG